MSHDLPKRREKSSRVFAIMMFVLALVLAGILLSVIHFQQLNKFDRRINELLVRRQKLEFFIPVAKETHFRIVDDPVAISRFARVLKVRNWKNTAHSTPAAGGVAIYIKPASDPNFLLIVGASSLWIELENKETYSFDIEPNTALKNAAAIAGFAYPILSGWSLDQ